MSGREKSLRGALAHAVAGISSLSIQEERLRLVWDPNSLHEEWAVVLFSLEGAWKELLCGANLECSDPLLRERERDLREAICGRGHLPADNPILGSTRLPWTIRGGHHDPARGARAAHEVAHDRPGRRRRQGSRPLWE